MNRTLTVALAIISIYSTTSAFKMSDTGLNKTLLSMFSRTLYDGAAIHGLEQKLTQILCNSNEKSIFIEFDDTLKSDIVNRIINRIMQCSSNATIPVTVLHHQ